MEEQPEKTENVLLIVKFLDFVQAEYNSLRSEILERSKSQLSILGLGITLLSATTYSGVYLQEKLYPLSVFAFCIAIPAITLFIIRYWLEELEGISYIGAYLAKLESETNTVFLNNGLKFKSRALAWESTIRNSENRRVKLTSAQLIVSTFCFSGLVSLMYSGFLLKEAFYLAVVVAIFFIAISTYTWRQANSVVRENFSRNYDKNIKRCENGTERMVGIPIPCISTLQQL